MIFLVNMNCIYLLLFYNKNLIIQSKHLFHVIIKIYYLHLLLLLLFNHLLMMYKLILMVYQLKFKLLLFILVKVVIRSL